MRPPADKAGQDTMRAWIAKGVSLCLAGLLASGCAAAGLVNQPPKTMRDDIASIVAFVESPAEQCATFGVRTAVPGTTIAACTTADGDIVMPNPCQWPGWDGYARLLCHELGHVNGWEHDNPVARVRAARQQRLAENDVEDAAAPSGD